MARTPLTRVMLGRASWTGKTERFSDGWLIRVFNEGRITGSFFPVNFSAKVPKGKNYLLEEVMMELISEPTVNPGGEVILKLTVKQENLLELVGSTATLFYGIGAGEYSSDLNLTLE